MTIKYLLLSLVFSFYLSSCGGGNSEGGGTGGDDKNILDGNQINYTELNEEGNNARASAEPTGYTLDANGIELIGVLAENSLGSTGDQYLIYSGSSDRIDLQVFLDGVGLENNAPEVSTDFDALNDDGISTLYSNSFRNIPIITDTYYLISIGLPLSNNSALNQPYTIQVKASSN